MLSVLVVIVKLTGDVGQDPEALFTDVLVIGTEQLLQRWKEVFLRTRLGAR